MPDDTIFSLFDSLSSTAILGTILYAILKFYISKLDKQHENYLRTQVEVLYGIGRLSTAVHNLQRIILQHDLTVRGINPHAGETDNERYTEAVSIYSKLLEHLSSSESATQEHFRKAIDTVSNILDADRK